MHNYNYNMEACAFIYIQIKEMPIVVYVCWLNSGTTWPFFLNTNINHFSTNIFRIIFQQMPFLRENLIHQDI